MFWKKKKQIEPQKILNETVALNLAQTIPTPSVEPQVIISSPTETVELKIENDKAIPFVTINGSLVFSLQDKFDIKSIFFDKNNGGIKTYIFNATEKEVQEYLGR